MEPSNRSSALKIVFHLIFSEDYLRLQFRQNREKRRRRRQFFHESDNILRLRRPYFYVS